MVTFVLCVSNDNYKKPLTMYLQLNQRYSRSGTMLLLLLQLLLLLHDVRDVRCTKYEHSYLVSCQKPRLRRSQAFGSISPCTPSIHLDPTRTRVCRTAYGGHWRTEHALLHACFLVPPPFPQPFVTEPDSPAEKRGKKIQNPKSKIIFPPKHGRLFLCGGSAGTFRTCQLGSHSAVLLCTLARDTIASRFSV